VNEIRMSCSLWRTVHSFLMMSFAPYPAVPRQSRSMLKALCRCIRGGRRSAPFINLQWLELTHRKLRLVPRRLCTSHSVAVNAEDIAIWNDSEAPSAQESPVFIVAFPVGHHLAEQALDAHPSCVQWMSNRSYRTPLIDHRTESVYPSGWGV